MKNHYLIRTGLSMTALSSLICQVLINFKIQQRLAGAMIRLCLAVMVSGVVLYGNRTAAQCCPVPSAGVVQTTTTVSPTAAGVENNDGGRDWNSTSTGDASESVTILALAAINMETVTWTIAPFVPVAGQRVCSVTDPTVTLNFPGALLSLSSSGINVTGSYTAGYTLTVNPSFLAIGLGTGTITATVTGYTVVTQTGCPLPVELRNFSGQQDGRCAKLNWSTYSERNNDYFTVQKLIGERFVDIANVPSLSGTTMVQSDYEFTDCDVANINYYRLVQTDRNGESEIIGELVSVPIDMEDPGMLTVVPNPAENFACVYSDNDLKHVRIVSPEGRIVKEEGLSGDERQYCITIDELPTGVYTVQVETSKGQVSKKLVVI